MVRWLGVGKRWVWGLAVALVGQTVTPNVNQAVELSKALADLIAPLITIVIVIALPMLVFRALAGEVVETAR